MHSLSHVHIFYKHIRSTHTHATDPRTRDFFLLQSPEKMLSIVGMYLVTVPLLMRFMQSRKGFNLRSVIFLYNFILVGLSGYMCYEVGIGWRVVGTGCVGGRSVGWRCWKGDFEKKMRFWGEDDVEWCCEVGFVRWCWEGMLREGVAVSVSCKNKG